MKWPGLARILGLSLIGCALVLAASLAARGPKHEHITPGNWYAKETSK